MSIDFNNLFLYNDGKLYWKIRPANKVKEEAREAYLKAKKELHMQRI